MTSGSGLPGPSAVRRQSDARREAGWTVPARPRCRTPRAQPPPLVQARQDASLLTQAAQQRHTAEPRTDQHLRRQADWNESSSGIIKTSRFGHGISTIPVALGVVLPHGARVPASSGALARHSFDRAAFAPGRDAIAIPGVEPLLRRPGRSPVSLDPPRRSAEPRRPGATGKSTASSGPFRNEDGRQPRFRAVDGRDRQNACAVR